MHNPKLSIVIPITNMAGRLENLRKTLLTVDWGKCEVLLIHDVRDELTGVELGKIKSIYEKHSISLFEGTLGSPGAARNLGLEKSTGEWIIFWDSDDFGNAQNVLNAVEENRDVEILVGSYQVADNITKITWKNKRASRLTDISFNPGLWRVAFRRECIQHIRFPEYLMGEDQVFLAKCLTLGLTYEFCDTLFYVYFTSVPNQLTSNKSAVNQLTKATIEAINLLNKQDGITEIFLLMMIFRQLVTNLKGNFRRECIPTIFMLFRVFIPRPAKFIQAAVRFMGQWLVSKMFVEVVS